MCTPVGASRASEIVDTLNRQEHKFSFKQVSKEAFATFFPGAAEAAETLSYFQAHTYLGSDSRDQLGSDHVSYPSQSRAEVGLVDIF